MYEGSQIFPFEKQTHNLDKLFLFKVVVGLAGAMAVNGDFFFMFEAGVFRCCGCCTSTKAASLRKKNAQPEELATTAQGVAVTPPDAPANVELVSGIRNRVPLDLSLDRPAMDDRVPLGLSFIGTPGNGCTEWKKHSNIVDFRVLKFYS